ncbi:MAG: T9SS type A sorting domain-containing protein, partial [Bacteroidales bacterium]|nr:T9SS type A sorting domain-containing protein [Bacteroidales bacterium]
TDETAISFNSNSTDDFDSYYDAFKLFTSTANVPQIYSFINDNSTICAINSVPDIYTERIIHVGFKATNSGDFTITVNDFQLSEYHDVYFEDTYTDETYDLYNLDYTFSSEIGQFDDRFIIKFRENSTEINDLNNLPNVQIYNYGDYLFLSSEIDDAIVGKIELINAVGQTVMLTENDNLYYTKIPLSCSNGMYVVRLINKYGMVTSKIIVNR